MCVCVSVIYNQGYFIVVSVICTHTYCNTLHHVYHIRVFFVYVALFICYHSIYTLVVYIIKPMCIDIYYNIYIYISIFYL